MSSPSASLDLPPAPQLCSAVPAQWSDPPIAADWQPLADAFFASPTGQGLLHFLQQRLDAGAVIYPPQPLRALALTPAATVRVVILGQDPYHGPGQAHGLAFSVPPGVPLPPSLRNIFEEIQRDMGTPPPRFPNPGGSLEHWARHGVLLLNTCLTVEQGQPASHAGRGWEQFTDALIAHVAARGRPSVFMLWGAHAQSKKSLIETQGAGRGHLVLCANHPSPLSARRGPMPFIGCGHFSQARDFRQQHGY